MAAPVYYTAEMVRGLSDENRKWPRYETVHGELLVTPAPRPWHERVGIRLGVALAHYLEREPIGEVFFSRSDISWGHDILVEPDLFVVAREEARTLDWSRMKTLLLVVETLSPSSVRSDRFAKRRLYQEVGVSLYWIIDADAQLVEIWTPEVLFPSLERQELFWHPQGASIPFNIRLKELFRPI
ncbi:MAG: Uma2 family endonuclease [Gemmatimonadaceae bacterium]